MTERSGKGLRMRKEDMTTTVERESTLADLHQAVVDPQYAQNRAAGRTRCKHCGVGDSARLQAAISQLVRVALWLQRDDIDLLIEPDE